MAGNVTFTMIKPGAVAAGNIGAILKIIQENGFHIAAMRLTQLTPQQAKQFYKVHEGKPFFEDMTNFMASAPIVAAILTKENAVADYRKLIGATNPAEAAEGTIRRMFATKISDNAVHGSDSDENALIEASFFFPSMERY
ncbi:MAG: nucleoside-diphosphate kinase [Salinivirgaceae bacterium]|nr:nucleoside-diphosphate kinase [Salinivirgaceae bacterium]